MASKKPSSLPITRALKRANQEFFDILFAEAEMSPVQEKTVKRFFGEPLWRPLAELEYNGLTSFENGLMLIGAGALHRSTFTIHRGPLSGRMFPAYELSEEVGAYLPFYGSAGDSMTELDDFLSDCIEMVQSYAAVDTGSGLIATRSMIEAALDFEDWDLLGRIRYLPDGHAALNDIARLDDGYRVDRMDYMDMIISRGENRTGADIIDLK